MKETPPKTQVPAGNARGLHNDFSDQEKTMTKGAMPPAFGLTASSAQNNPGAVQAKPAQPKLNVSGVPTELQVMLEKFEGIRYEVYRDTLGHLTGGMGHLIKADELAAFPEGTHISQAQVEAWAQVDVGAAWKRGQEQAQELGVNDHDFFVAMASMCFQNGVSWNTKHVKTWALMKEHKWEEAAIEAADSKWARETPTRVPGFQAALRSQIKAGDASGGLAHKHTLTPKAKATKLEQAAKEAEATKTPVPQGKEGMKQIQTKLQELGLYNDKIDGIATSSHGESKTVRGIKAFQQSHGLAVTGEVDATTWAALNKVESLSIWQGFMANLEKQQATKVNAPKASGFAEPFKEKVAEAKKEVTKLESADSANATGSFVDKKYWRTQQTAEEGGQAGFISPSASPTACRYVSSEMLILYMKAEKPEILKELGVSGIADLAFGVKKDVTENSADAGGFLRILQEDASKQTGGYTKNVQNPDAMVVNDQASDAITYIDEKLSAGIPLVVGVDHTFNRARNEGTTDHFITLTGIGKTAEGKKFYHFFDPARSNQANGVDNSGKNRLVEESKGIYRAPQPTGSGNAQRYYLTTVIVFPADRKKFKKD